MPLVFGSLPTDSTPNMLFSYNLIPKEKSVPGESHIVNRKLYMASNEDVVGRRLVFNGKKYDMSVDLAVDCIGYMQMNGIIDGNSELSRKDSHGNHFYPSILVKKVNGIYVSDDEDNAVECKSLEDFIVYVNLHKSSKLTIGTGLANPKEESSNKSTLCLCNLYTLASNEYDLSVVKDLGVVGTLKNIQTKTTAMIAESERFKKRHYICHSYMYQVTKVIGGYFVQCFCSGELYDFYVFVQENSFTTKRISGYIAENFKMFKCNRVGGGYKVEVSKDSIVKNVMGVIKILPQLWVRGTYVDSNVQNMFIFINNGTDLKELGFDCCRDDHQMTIRGTSGHLIRLKNEASDNRYFIAKGKIGDPSKRFSTGNKYAFDDLLEDISHAGTFHSVGFVVI